MNDVWQNEMASFGFIHRAGGILSKKISPEYYQWLSIDFSVPDGDVLVGSIFPGLTKKLYEIAKLTSISAKPAFAMSWGPPAFSHKLGTAADEDLMQPYKLVRSVESFLTDKADLGQVIEALRQGELFSWNRAQVVASGLVTLGRCSELRELEREGQAQGAVAEFVRAANAICSAELH